MNEPSATRPLAQSRVPTPVSNSVIQKAIFIAKMSLPNPVGLKGNLPARLSKEECNKFLETFKCSVDAQKLTTERVQVLKEWVITHIYPSADRVDAFGALLHKSVMESYVSDDEKQYKVLQIAHDIFSSTIQHDIIENSETIRSDALARHVIHVAEAAVDGTSKADVEKVKAVVGLWAHRAMMSEAMIAEVKANMGLVEKSGLVGLRKRNEMEKARWDALVCHGNQRLAWYRQPGSCQVKGLLRRSIWRFDVNAVNTAMARVGKPCKTVAKDNLGKLLQTKGGLKGRKRKVDGGRGVNSSGRVHKDRHFRGNGFCFPPGLKASKKN